MIDFERTRETLHQCPRCSKYALVQRDPDKFYCLWCNFNRDVSDAGESSSVLFVIGFFIFLLLIVSSALEPTQSVPVQPASQEQTSFP